MRVLSLSSQVVQGHIGNSALALPLARLGVELLAVPTVVFSNHPGSGSFDGVPLEARVPGLMLDALEQHGLLAGLDGVLSGYLGESWTATLLRDRLLRWRRERPDLPYLLDPAKGDTSPGEHGRLYVVSELPRVIRRELLPLADWVRLNPFELAMLSRGEPESEPAALARQARQLLGDRCQAVLVTSYAEGERLGALLILHDGAWRLLAPKLRIDPSPHGAGDLLSGLWLIELLRTAEPLQAARYALAQLHGVLQETARQGLRELALLQAQDRLARGEENGVEVSALG